MISSTGNRLMAAFYILWGVACVTFGVDLEAKIVDATMDDLGHLLLGLCNVFFGLWLLYRDGA